MHIRHTLCFLLLLTATSSCISLGRLVDNSPFGGTASPDRVNLWPIAYADQDRLAVLWPIFDQDQRGFALRPLVAREGSQWEVLPPLCYFDTESGNWFSLGAYSINDNYGLFPFYNRGWINNVGPFWWDTDEAGDVTHGGLFPVVKLGPDFSYAGPVYWNKDEEGEVESLGLFPLAHYGPSFNYTGLAFWNLDDTGAVVRGGLFPIAHIDQRPDSFNWVGPAYWIRGEEGVSSRGLFPIAHLSEENENPNWVGPVYWYRDEAGAMQFSGVFPLANFSPTLNHVGPVYWVKNEEGTTSYRGLFPLVHSGPDLSFAGPVWWRRNQSGEVDHRGLFPVAAFTPGFNYVGPFLWSGDEDAAIRNWAMLPLAAQSNSKDGSGAFISLLGGRGWEADGSTRFLNVLGALYHYGREQDEWWMSVPFFTMSESPERSRWDLWPLIGREEQRTLQGQHLYNVHRGLTGLIEHQSTTEAGRTETHRFRVWPLFSYRDELGRGSPIPDFLSLFALQTRGDRVDYHVINPWIFDYRSSEKSCDWSAVLGLANYEADQTHSEFNLGYLLYRQKSSPEGTTRDIFPFITVDTGEKQGGFSFLWRLLHYRREGDRVGGHFLFIPWGDTGDGSRPRSKG